MERVIRFDTSEKDRDRFAAMYRAFVTGIIVATNVQAQEKRTLAAARIEARLQDLCDEISVSADDPSSTGEPMRQLKPGPQMLTMTQEQHSALKALLELAIPRLRPSLQRQAIDALDFIDGAEKREET